MRNRWGVEIKKGHWVSGRGSRGDAVQGRVAKIERTGDYARAYGPRVILDTGESLGVDDIAQTLGPMTVGRGGVVKQNPAGSTEAVELYWHALNDSGAMSDFFDRQGNDPRSVSDWTAFATKAAKSYAREYADASQWADMFPAEVRRETAQLLLRRYIDDINPVNPNPLTRVRIKSPPQRPAGNTSAPSKRLVKRRKKTAKAAPGVYANPTPHIALWRWRIQERASESAQWRDVSAIHYKQGIESATRAAKDWADRHPKMYVRLLDDWE